MVSRTRWSGPHAQVAAVLLAACSLETGGLGTSAGVSIGENGSNGSADAESGSESGNDDIATTAVDGTADGANGCIGDATCSADAPNGWTGPFAIYTASPPHDGQQCPPGWTPGPVGTLDLTAPPPTCACNCVPAPATCSVSVGYYSDAACSQPQAEVPLGAACTPFYDQDAHGFVRASATIAGVNCTPSEEYVIPPVQWAEASVLCSPPSPATCTEGLCLPPPPVDFDERWCVIADGEQPCPAGPYSTGKTMFSRLDDDRSCTPCGCSVANQPSCGEVREYFDAFCAIPAGTAAIDGACHDADIDNSDAWGARYEGAASNYSCTNNGPTPVGQAVAADPITICCTG